MSGGSEEYTGMRRSYAKGVDGTNDSPDLECFPYSCSYSASSPDYSIGSLWQVSVRDLCCKVANVSKRI